MVINNAFRKAFETFATALVSSVTSNLERLGNKAMFLDIDEIMSSSVISEDEIERLRELPKIQDEQDRVWYIIGLAVVDKHLHALMLTVNFDDRSMERGRTGFYELVDTRGNDLLAHVCDVLEALKTELDNG